MNWTITCTFFDQLTPQTLYALLRLRSEVFVVEQNCVFLDADNKDQYCHHLLAWNHAGELAACVRLVPPGISYPQMSIGRVASSPSARRTGAGRFIMQQAILEIQSLYRPGPIRIGAQQYLQQFYESFGFVQSSKTYLEDNIPHIEMIRS